LDVVVDDFHFWHRVLTLVCSKVGNKRIDVFNFGKLFVWLKLLEHFSRNLLCYLVFILLYEHLNVFFCVNFFRDIGNFLACLCLSAMKDGSQFFEAEFDKIYQVSVIVLYLIELGEIT
jgi:hypothetical protein